MEKKEEARGKVIIAGMGRKKHKVNI